MTTVVATAPSNSTFMRAMLARLRAFATAPALGAVQQ
jgi:hypothetical protein